MAILTKIMIILGVTKRWFMAPSRDMSGLNISVMTILLRDDGPDH